MDRRLGGWRIRPVWTIEPLDPTSHLLGAVLDAGEPLDVPGVDVVQELPETQVSERVDPLPGERPVDRFEVDDCDVDEPLGSTVGFPDASEMIVSTIP